MPGCIRRMQPFGQYKGFRIAIGVFPGLIGQCRKSMRVGELRNCSQQKGECLSFYLVLQFSAWQAGTSALGSAP